MRKSDYLNNNTEYFLNNKESQKSSEDLKSIKTYFFNNLVFIGSLMSQYRNTSSRKVILVIITIINQYTLQKFIENLIKSLHFKYDKTIRWDGSSVQSSNFSNIDFVWRHLNTIWAKWGLSKHLFLVFLLHSFMRKGLNFEILKSLEFFSSESMLSTDLLRRFVYTELQSLTKY